MSMQTLIKTEFLKTRSGLWYAPARRVGGFFPDLEIRAKLYHKNVTKMTRKCRKFRGSYFMERAVCGNWECVDNNPTDFNAPDHNPWKSPP